MRTTLHRLLGKIITHGRATRSIQRAARQLFEDAAAADVADTGVDEIPGNADGRDLAASIAEGFKAAGQAIIDKVFSGGMTWEQAKAKLDKLFKSIDSLKDEDTPLAESLREMRGDTGFARRVLK